MLLGKRPRPPMKRNTSMTEFTIDFTQLSSHPSDPPHRPTTTTTTTTTTLVHHHHPFFSHRSADYDNNFLRSCSLCKRRLIPGHDIYMYRGDSGFCSVECRQEQIIDDERKEKKFSSASHATPISEL